MIKVRHPLKDAAPLRLALARKSALQPRKRRVSIEWFRNRVFCADALEFMRSLPENSIDMILTSPPYDNLRVYNGYTFDFEGIATQCYRTLKPGGVTVWVVGDETIEGSESLISFEQALSFQRIGFKVWDTMIWTKYLAGNYGKRYGHHFEYMFILVKGREPKTFNPITRKNAKAGAIGTMGRRNKDGWKTTGKRIVQPESIIENVWHIPVGNNLTTTEKDLFGKHPAMFPEKLAEMHIYSWSNPGDVVLDPMAGSGTTLKMARQLNRNYIGCDISQEYVDLIDRRLAKPYTKNMFERPQAAGE